MEAAIPLEVWEDKENRKIITKEIQNIIQTQNEEKQIIEIVNGIIKKCKDENASWSVEALNVFKDDLFKKIESYFGENNYTSFPKDKRNRIEHNAYLLLVMQMEKNLGRGEFAKIQKNDDRVKAFLLDNFKVNEQNLEKIYHPSAVEVYKPPIRKEDGRYYLGSPMVSAIRNPMAMRALHQLRKVINELIENDIIDASTRIHIEMARGLMNANERKAYQTWQHERETKRIEYSSKIKEHFGLDAEPSDTDILKYQLWEEQNHKCLYTGNEISLTEFLGANPKYDIEHTIPRSLSFDNSQENKTLCENHFNRSIKRNKIPFKLIGHDQILERIEDWKVKYEELEKQIQVATRQSRNALDKDSKDKAIQKRHRLTYEKNYWKNKYYRFTMEDVPEGFKNSQLVDTGIISKYSRLYLKTLFDKVYTVKGNTVSDFRKMWGLQDEYEKKARVNHIHHCIDAVTIACITKENYENLARFYHEWEDLHIKGVDQLPQVSKPWSKFTEDIKGIEKEVLISHHTPDVLPRQSKKKLRKRGQIQYNNMGNPTFLKGDTVRGSLHKEMFYGAIERVQENKKGELEKQIKYVIRKPLDSLDDSSLKDIVDDRVREIVLNARLEEKQLNNEVERLKKLLSKAEENEAATIKQDIQNFTNNIERLYVLPNKNGDPVPIKKVRIFQPSVTNPLHVKLQRDKSKKSPKPYKEQYHVVNDSNYLMAIYEGKDEKGNVKRSFEIVNNLEAGEFFKYSVHNVLKAQNIGHVENLIPSIKVSGKLEMPLKAIIKIGTMVILWEKTPKEIWELSSENRNKRVYKIIGLSNQRIVHTSGKIYEYGTIVMRFHQEALPSSELKVFDGKFEQNEEYKAQRKLNHNQFNALVDGVDFKISSLGVIHRIPQ
jgi:CRISPR-associated endonuclease Csn1